MSLRKESIPDSSSSPWSKTVRKIKLLLLAFPLLALLLLFLAGGGGFLFARYQVHTSFSADANEQVFIVAEGEGVQQIARNLEEGQLICDHLWFSLYVLYRGWSSQLKAGDYSFSPSLTPAQIADRIAHGDVISERIKVTIPEGFTLKQIDVRLAEAGLIAEGELAALTDLEGYLFPDTYFFSKKDNLNNVLDKIEINFNDKVDGELRAAIEEQGKTLDEIITMASILEKEMTYYSDQRIVSGIFWQRVADSYPLQSCATVGYVLGEHKWRYSIADTKIDSPYNTYQNVGLPPGPICNPGLWAIKAAVYPEFTDYYFFLSTEEGETIYSRTAEEHEANKVRYLGG